MAQYPYSTARLASPQMHQSKKQPMKTNMQDAAKRRLMAMKKAKPGSGSRPY